MARQFGAGKVSPDGWRFVGGERGWVFEGHKIEYRDGKWVHVDGIDKTAARASPKMTAKEKQQCEEKCKAEEKKCTAGEMNKKEAKSCCAKK